jgi:CelD/BcsL family acetyltransferase involved in cellulose biosynthesis
MDGPMLSPAWIVNWWQVFGPHGGRRLRVAVFTQGERLVGLAPLLARRQVYPLGIPFRRLELLASGEPEKDEICSEYIGIVAERGVERDVAAAFCSALASGQFGDWDELVAPGMAGDGPMPGLLLDALRSKGIDAESVPSGACSYVPLPQSWDDYLAALPSSGRYVVRRSLRDFESWSGGSVELRFARTPSELDAGLLVLKALHAERWSGGGVFNSKRFNAFHDAVTRDLLAENALELSWLVARGQPIAAAYNIVWNGKEYFYQSGRALDVPKEIRPGIVLHALAIRRAIVAGRLEYDFLRGRSQYKRQLATATRPLVRIRAVRAPVRDFVRRASELGFHRVGELRRNVLGQWLQFAAVQGSRHAQPPPSARTSRADD